MVKQFLKSHLGSIVAFAVVAIFVVWGYFSIQAAKNNAVTYSTEYEAPEGNVDSEDEGSYELVAQTDSLALYYNAAKGAIQVENLETGYLWKGICDDEVYDMDSINSQWAAYLQSPICISYNDLEKRDAGVKKLYGAQDCGYLETEYIENGVAVTYGFLTPGIYVTIEYTLEDDQLVVRMPVDKIVEETKYALTTVELLPFFGASANEDADGNAIDGYLFYPDGSGAITTYANADSRPSNVKVAYYYTYTNKTVSFDNLTDEDTYNRYTASMPVYGIKNGDNALFAMATEGEANTGIVVYASGYVVDLNHAGFELYTRNVYVVDMYSMSSSDSTTATGATVQRVDTNLIEEDKEVRYTFLSGNDADYSGMAASYREYLQETGQLTTVSLEASDMTLALTLLMGTTKDGLIFDEYITMTTFEQAEEILTRLSELGVTNTETVLRAWQSDYDDYEYWGPASSLGGKSGLKSLNEFIAENSSNNLYLESSFMIASSKTSGITKKTDVAYDGVGLELSMEDDDGTVYYLLNPLKIFRRNQMFLEKLESYENYGVAYEDVGRYAYADFNETGSYTKGETVEKLEELLQTTADEDRNVAVNGSNQYSLAYATYLYNLREDAYGLNVTDYAVPFVEMVVSGLIPYSTEGAGNLSYDLQTQKLKWIEYGAMPYFYLTYESALNLRDTSYDEVFSSTYDDWEETVVETYLEFAENLSCVWGRQMTDHTILTNDLIKVTYDNGTVIYINYADEAASVDGVQVEANSYTVVEGGE
ncbi:MAG: DUF5696 domain-containing protein [Lachnospiraceae bacterium]|nr:DUF5696 domain-containing protein [Lachnospiraceae bacterium]